MAHIMFYNTVKFDVQMAQSQLERERTMRVDDTSIVDDMYTVDDTHGIDDFQILKDIDDIVFESYEEGKGDAVKDTAALLEDKPIWQQLVLQDVTPEQMCESQIAIGKAIRFAPEDVRHKLRQAVAYSLNQDPGRCHFIEHMFNKGHSAQLTHAALTQTLMNNRIRLFPFLREQKMRGQARRQLLIDSKRPSTSVPTAKQQRLQDNLVLKKEIINIKFAMETSLTQILVMRLASPNQAIDFLKMRSLREIRDELSTQVKKLQDILRRL